MTKNGKAEAVQRKTRGIKALAIAATILALAVIALLIYVIVEQPFRY